MKAIRDAQKIIGLLEDGDLSSDLSKEITKTLEALREQAGAKGKIKGSVSLTLGFEIDGPTCEIMADIKSSVPRPKRSPSFFFLTEDGLSTEHPRQPSFFEEEQQARSTRSAS